MVHVKQLATKVAVSLVAVGSLTAVGMAGAGVAGASSSTTVPTTSPAGTAPAVHLRHTLRQFMCSHEAAMIRHQAAFAAATAKDQAQEEEALAAGNTRRAKLFRSVVAHRTVDEQHMKIRLAARIARDHSKGWARAAC